MVKNMIKLGANVIKTAQKGSNLTQTGNFDHVLNLKYRAYLSGFPILFVLTSVFPF